MHSSPIHQTLRAHTKRLDQRGHESASARTPCVSMICAAIFGTSTMATNTTLIGSAGYTAARSENCEFESNCTALLISQVTNNESARLAARDCFSPELSAITEPALLFLFPRCFFFSSSLNCPELHQCCITALA